MKALIFGEGLLKPTLSGDKKITIRKFRPEAHSFTEGEIIKGIFKDGLIVLLRIRYDTETKIMFRLTDSEAKENGYFNVLEAFEGLKNIIPILPLTLS